MENGVVDKGERVKELMVALRAIRNELDVDVMSLGEAEDVMSKLRLMVQAAIDMGGEG